MIYLPQFSYHFTPRLKKKKKLFYSGSNRVLANNIREVYNWRNTAVHEVNINTTVQQSYMLLLNVLYGRG